MKENIKLFWQNMVNNKYWIPLLLFAFMALVLAKENIEGIFDNSRVVFWLMEGFFIAVSLVIIIATWVTKDSQE